MSSIQEEKHNLLTVFVYFEMSNLRDLRNYDDSLHSSPAETNHIPFGRDTRDRRDSEEESIALYVTHVNSPWNVIQQNYPNIRFMKLEIFLNLRKFHSFDIELTVSISEINRDESVLVFISHSWSDIASNGKFLPDNKSNKKFHLTADGVKKLKEFAPQMQCYLWIDVSCLDTYSPDNNILDHLIALQCCDVVFTPIVDEITSRPLVGETFFEDFKSEHWSEGERAYLKRGWCRLEMLSAFHLPAFASEECRIKKFEDELFKASQRPHFIYSSREEHPIMLQPQEQFFLSFNPLTGGEECPNERRIITDLLKRLRRAIPQTFKFHDEINVSTVREAIPAGDYSKFPSVIWLGLLNAGKTTMIRKLLGIENITFSSTFHCHVYFSTVLQCYFIDTPGFDLISESWNKMIVDKIRNFVECNNFCIIATIVLQMYRSFRGITLRIPGWLSFVKSMMKSPTESLFYVVADVSGADEPAVGGYTNAEGCRYINMKFIRGEYANEEIEMLSEAIKRKISGNDEPFVREQMPINTNCLFDYPESALNVTVLSNVIGRGKFGIIYKGIYGCDPVAVKCFRENWTEFKNNVKNEIEILSKLSGVPGVIRFYGYCFHENRPRFVMELADFSLYDVLYGDKNIRFDMNAKLDYAWQIAITLTAIGNFKIVHRDIKPANILIIQRAGSLYFRIADFGIACKVGLEEKMGTMAYMAPETIENGHFTTASDVYAFGVLLNELFTEQKPLHGINDAELANKIRFENLRPTIYKAKPQSCVDNMLVALIQSCWITNPADRVPFSRIVDQEMTHQGIESQGIVEQLQSIKKKVIEDDVYSPRIRRSSSISDPDETQLVELITNVAMDTNNTIDLNVIVPVVKDIILKDFSLLKSVSNLNTTECAEGFGI